MSLSVASFARKEARILLLHSVIRDLERMAHPLLRKLSRAKQCRIGRRKEPQEEVCSLL